MNPPDWLSEIAAEEWRRVATKLKRKPDAASLAAYCTAYARWREAEAAIARDGAEIVIRDDKGAVKSVIVSPQVAISEKYLKSMTSTAMMLGIV